MFGVLLHPQRELAMGGRSTGPRVRALNQINVVIGKAVRKGDVMRPTAEAARIAREHPDCGMTPAEISERIFQLAVERRLDIDPSG